MSSTDSSNPSLSNQRFVFIDAWRGIACLMVLFCHIYVHFIGAWKVTTPKWLDNLIISGGNNGVTIFFVISGFVIAYSVRNVPVNKSNILRFALRRQIRLDPVYWVAIVISLGVLALERLLSEQTEKMFSPIEVLLNASYLHMFTETRPVLGVAWTLCIEIQFYLAFVLILWFSKGLKKLYSPLQQNYLVESLLMISVSIAGLVYWDTSPYHGAYFVPVFCYFTLGALTSWAVLEKIPPILVWGVIALSLFTGIITESRPLLVGSATTIMFFAVALRNKLRTSWNWRWIQFLGSISYSMYLIHRPIGLLIVMRVGYKLTGPSLISGITWSIVAVMASVFSAWILYRLVERPSQKWAASIPRVTSHKPSTSLSQA